MVLILVVTSSCESQHSKDFLTFSGKIENNKDTVISVIGKGFKKNIKINTDGSFKDTLSVKEEKIFSIYSPKNGQGVAFLKNGYDIFLNANTNDFFNSFTFMGDNEASDSNNFIVDRYKFAQQMGSAKDFMGLQKEDFLKKINQLKKGLDSLSSVYSYANDQMLQESKEQVLDFFQKLIDNYDRMHANLVQQKAINKNLKKGNPAPEFFNYENSKGGTNSLKDFRGKYVYIDVWATWCRPCIAQIPYLKKLEEEYKNKNIVFVSISTDDDRRSNGSWEKAHDKWKKMVTQKNLSGIQLWAGKDDARFSVEYAIRGIPRFILIDPKGNIVDSDTKRPTDPSIRSMLNNLPGI